MAEDERLREALLELQLLREREAKSLAETRTLLECLEAYSSAATPGEALNSIFLSLRNAIGADVSLLGEIAPNGDFVVVAADDRSLSGTRLTPPFDLSARSRDVLDLKVMGEWSGPFDLTPFTTLQSVPVLSGGLAHAMVVLKKDRRGFGKGSLRLVERLAGLALRALQGRRIASENKLLAAAIHGSSSGFAIADATQEERPLIYVNEAFERISGYDAAEVLGENCRFLSAEADNSPERTRLRKAVRNNEPGQFLLANKRKDGTPFWNELTLFPVENGLGQVTSLVATQNDVSARVQAAAERDRTRTQMARALGATEDAFLVLEGGGLEGRQVIAFANEATRDVFYAPAMNWAVGTTFDENWGSYLEASQDMPGRITALIERPDLKALAKLPNGREIDLPDGRTVLIRAANLPENSLVLSATDVTPMKSAQRLLSQRLAAIEAARDGIAVTDDTGRLTYLNSAASDMLGFGSTTLALGKPWYAQYGDAQALRGLVAFEKTLERSTGETVRTHEVTGTVLESGGSVILFRDITDRLEFEVREADLKTGIQQLQRQEATAQLAAGIAHDFNNLLSAINGSATLIGLEEDLTEGLKAHVDRISTAGNHAARLVNRLLDLGAHDDATGTFDLASSLRDIPALVGPSLPKSIAFDMSLPQDAVPIKGDPSALSQVLVNLVLNARDAIGHDGGRIELDIQRVAGRRAGKVRVGELVSSQDYVRIDVSDTGSGIEEAELNAVFEPYFSTKGRRGTGLGLAMVSLQVQGIGGAVGLCSAKGEGTTVSVYWPIAEYEAPGAGAGDETRHNLTGQTIIVVDDDPDVATVASKYLEAQGAEVAICIDPRDAVEAIEDAPDAWSAVVTDYDMPQMTGGDLAEKVKRAGPRIPVVLVTALARRLSDPRINDGTIDAVLPKPTDLNHLSSLLSQYHQREN